MLVARTEVSFSVRLPTAEISARERSCLHLRMSPKRSTPEQTPHLVFLKPYDFPVNPAAVSLGRRDDDALSWKVDDAVGWAGVSLHHRCGHLSKSQ